jgi:hypothetical protein
LGGQGVLTGLQIRRSCRQHCIRARRAQRCSTAAWLAAQRTTDLSSVSSPARWLPQGIQFRALSLRRSGLLLPAYSDEKPRGSGSPIRSTEHPPSSPQTLHPRKKATPRPAVAGPLRAGRFPAAGCCLRAIPFLRRPSAHVCVHVPFSRRPLRPSDRTTFGTGRVHMFSLRDTACISRCFT